MDVYNIGVFSVEKNNIFLCHKSKLAMRTGKKQTKG